MFPVAFVTSILVTVSNILLLRKEGKNWKNMLGLILGGFICVSTVFLILGTSSQPYHNAFSALLILHNCESFLSGHVAVSPFEDDKCNDSVQEIRHKLGPDQAIQSPDQIHPDHDRDNQYNVSDQCEQK